MTTVLTYGTFDLFHVGHLNLLERLAVLGDRLIVAVSTDEFNATKGKASVVSFENRSRIVEAIKGVDLVIPENSWDQKPDDIRTHAVDIFAIGDDWSGRFDHLEALCAVNYLPRTTGTSTTQLKRSLRALDPQHIAEMENALAVIGSLVSHYRDLA